ncbi:MAG: YkgJ family cysteine cluster protein [Thermodesulfobacteriota bacterium]|nr:MAG: YkgJ family cysteine cluster protein [Thermodesulfobacteriota bacterium]
MHVQREKKDLIVPVRLDLKSTFTFACEKEMACYTRCCKDAYIMLTPCDIIRMKQRLGLSSDEFLHIYTTLGHIEKTDLPIPVIKMLEDDEKSCPFLEEPGCGIYEDRPLTCRYYPLSAGMFHDRDLSSDEPFFALIKEGHCLGHDLGRELTVDEWRKDQGIIPYDEANFGWTELILKRKSLGPFVTIPEKTLQMFFMGCYNIDRFRRFVFDSLFLNVYIVPEERKKKISEDDMAMLEFAVDWLKTTLLGEQKLEIREQVAEKDPVEVEAQAD